MYTVIDRRGVDLARLDETTKRAQVEYFPDLQAAAGFIGFYLVADEDLFTAIFVWDDKAHADAFEPTMRAWETALEEMGHKGVTQNQGETVVALEASH
jgi:quinol monooxygenase YgiN